MRKGWFCIRFRPIKMLALTLALGAGLLAIPMSRPPADQPAMAHAHPLPTILVDAGHGGVDGGAVGADNIQEKEINLEIALKLRDLLRFCGFSTQMTRETDCSIHDKDAVSIRQQKESDLHNRLAMLEGMENGFLISIHQNKFELESCRGAQIFYGPLNEESQAFGELLQTRMVADLDPANNRKAKQCGSNVFLIYRAKQPAVLVECGFLSNREEAALLTTDEYQKKIAASIVGSLYEYEGIQRGAN